MKKIIYFLIYWSGLNFLYSLYARKRLYLVMYHSVSSRETSERLRGDLYTHVSIDAAQFEEQIQYLKKRGHTFITFKDLATLDLKDVHKPTIIYFDDGFKDVQENALAILAKHHIPATLFLITGVLDRTHMLWTILYRHILTTQGMPPSKQDEAIEEIKTRSDTERLEIMRRYAVEDYQELFDIFLSWGEVRTLSQAHFEMGSHGVSHRHMTECSPQEFEYEARRSKERIEAEVGTPVTSFSFPYGRGTEALAQKLRELGYKYVVSSGKGLNTVKPGSSMLYLKNVSPKPGDSLRMFALKLYFLNLKS